MMGLHDNAVQACSAFPARFLTDMPAWENCGAHRPTFVTVAVDIGTAWLLNLMLAARNSPSDGNLAPDFGWVLILEAAKGLVDVAAFQLDIDVF